MLRLGPFGQQPQITTYTLLTLGFSIKDDSDQDTIVSLLEKSANEMVPCYPWLAGQIVNEKSEDEKEPNSGTYKIVNYRPHEQHSKFVHVKDCRDLCPSYADLIKNRAPLSMLDGSIISPAYGFPYPYPANVATPVVIVQANFIRGGLLLTSCAHHLAMDANGHEQFITQFARVCRYEKLLYEHVCMGNADQQTIVPPLRQGQVPSPMEMFRCASKLNDPAGPWPPTGSGETWKLFRLTAAKIAALKDEASKECSSDSDIKYISSNDAVTTFIWTRLTAVRAKSLPQDSRTMLIRGINGRKRLASPVSEGYMGHFIHCSSTALPLATVLDDSLSATAIKVRKSLMEINDYQIRSYFSLLQAEKDKTTFAFGAKFNPETDMMITSFVAQKLYSTSFGSLLGMPDFVRRPRLPDGKGLCYMMPITREGDIDIVIGLSDEEYEGLKADARWKEYAEVIE